MKIDLEQEKFLTRIDLRINTLCAVTNHIEKIISRSLCMKPQEQKKWDEHIDDFHKELLENIRKYDKQIVDEFDKLKEQIKGE